MTEQEIRLQLAEIVGTWIGAMAVVIGGIFGIYQFLEHKSALQVDRTMSFVERYHANTLLVEARLKVADVTTRRIDDINLILKDAKVTSDNLAVLYNAEIVKIVKEENLAGSLEQLLTFYEQILVCRNMALCEDEVAENFFDNDGRAYLRTFYPYICHIRSEWNNPQQYERVVNYYLGEKVDICET